MLHILTRSRFVALLTVLIVLFLTLQITYILRLPLVMDEFQGAGLLNRLTETVPYRDFRPYKTVLGYYLQIPALEWRSDLWQGLMNVKIQMAVMTAAALALASVHLRRHFRGAAVLLGLGLTVVMSTLLERGADLRVDTLTALFGFGSLLLLMDRRFIWAGIACAVSFLVSQKGVYYVLASNAALGLFWLLVKRDQKAFRDLLVFNAAAAVTLLAYLSFWSVIAGPQSVIHATFLSHGQIALGAGHNLQLHYWTQTLLQNPLFYGLGALALWRLEQRRRQQRPG